MSIHTLEEVLHPQSIAVVGASGSGGRGAGFITPLLDFGFKGKIYPVNPKYSEVLGMKAYPTIKDIPDTVDFVISAVPAPQVPKVLEDCSQKGVKGIHLYTARFSETGRQDAIELEQEVLEKAKKWGIRIIGPNCMGVYYPQQGLSWSSDFPKEVGTVGLASQSGQAAMEIIRSASQRGVFFSKAISYGNAIDFNECDFLDYLSQDPEVKLILMYIEGVKDGQRFFPALRRATATKPVIIIKGGRGKAGTRATASHTASLTASTEIWGTLISQAGAFSARNIDELIDLAVSFYFLPPIRGRRVGVAAGAGGATVLAADQCEEAGLDVIPLPPELRESLKKRGVRIWDWISNPADFSINMGDTDFGPTELLQMMAENENFDLIIASVSAPGRGGPPHGPPGKGGPPGGSSSAHGSGPPAKGGPPHPGGAQMSVDDYLAQYQKINSVKPLLGLVPDISPSSDDWDEARWKSASEVATKLIEAKIPFYPTIERAARAASKLIDYYQQRR